MPEYPVHTNRQFLHLPGEEAGGGVLACQVELFVFNFSQENVVTVLEGVGHYSQLNAVYTSEESGLETGGSASIVRINVNEIYLC